METLQKQQKENKNKVASAVYKKGKAINAPLSGYFQHFSTDNLLQIADTHNMAIRFLHPTGSFVLQDTPFLEISNTENIDKGTLDKIFTSIDFYNGQQIKINNYYGFQHLMEVGVKALSPGINDPGTAVISLHALTDLLAYRLKHPQPAIITGKEGTPRIFTVERTVQELFNSAVLPIWHYGKEDQQIQHALLQMIRQLNTVDTEGVLAATLNKFAQQVKLQSKGK